MNKIFDGISVSEFEGLVEQFIECEDPFAMSLEAFDEAVHLELDEMTNFQVELTGTIKNGKIVFDRPRNAPILVYDNKVIIGGLHLIVNLRDGESKNGAVRHDYDATPNINAFATA